MKYLFSLITLFFVLYVVAILYIIKYKNLEYSDIDVDSNGLVSITEILYALDTKKRFICEKNETIRYFDDINETVDCEKIYLEIYSLKDGLSLKKIDKSAR